MLANYGLENLRFITPVSPGDTIRVDADREADHAARDRRVRRGALGRGAHNQNDEIVATYDVLTLVAKEA